MIHVLGLGAGIYILNHFVSLGRRQGPSGGNGGDGSDGSDGNDGNDGSDGEKGSLGHRGEQGVRGEKGERGERGVRGEKGERGQQGERGERGERDERGERGERGEKRRLNYPSLSTDLLKLVDTLTGHIKTAPAYIIKRNEKTPVTAINRFIDKKGVILEELRLLKAKLENHSKPAEETIIRGVLEENTVPNNTRSTIPRPAATRIRHTFGLPE